VDDFVLEDFAGQTPAVKPALLSAVFASTRRILKLLDEIEAGRIAPHELDVTRTGQLLKHSVWLVQILRNPECAIALFGRGRSARLSIGGACAGES